MVDLREADGSLFRILEGDVAQKSDTGGLFEVGADDLEDAQRRCVERLLSATGPMFGSKMRRAGGAVGELERAVLEEVGVAWEGLAAFSKLGEGTRRSLRLLVSELTWENSSEGLLVRFVLPKGGYATTVLSRVCRCVDPHRT